MFFATGYASNAALMERVSSLVRGVSMGNKVLKLFALILSISLIPLSAFSEEKGVNVVFIPKSSDQDFWKFMRQGVDARIREEHGVDLIWRGPAYNDDTDSQIKILQLYAKPGVDAIIISPTDQVRLIEPAKQAVALGIKLIVVDSKLDGGLEKNFVTTDNYAAGKLAAEGLSKLLGGQGKVAIIRTVKGSASTEDRANGFIDYIKKYSPKIEISADIYAGGSSGKVYHNGGNFLKQRPQIDGVFTVNESASDGMLRALRKEGLEGKLRFIGFDSTDFLLDGLKKHHIDGLIVQDPRRMGYLGVNAAIAAVKGNAIKDRIIFVDAVMVTLDNFQKPEIQSLLTP